ncbi:MAG: oxygen-insensitive NAD(P)H nitroreductase [Opitutae bacterium]|nr:oxygen-insensitive NAD(P)H nitroreductase [Opitutae bacterium]
MDIADIATSRHAAKAFDPAKRIPESLFEQLLALLRNSPSSVNSQPWHFVVAASDAGKARIAPAAHGPYAYNEPKIRGASHVVVLCARTDIDAAHLNALLAQETRDGRYPDAAAQEAYRKSRAAYVELHRARRQDLPHWMEKQVYLALGSLLLGAAALGLDACPMEGFDATALDAELGLPARGLKSVAIVALGFRGPGDWNAPLPKSRLPAETLFTLL